MRRSWQRDLRQAEYEARVAATGLETPQTEATSPVASSAPFGYRVSSRDSMEVMLLCVKCGEFFPNRSPANRAHFHRPVPLVTASDLMSRQNCNGCGEMITPPWPTADESSNGYTVDPF